MYRYTLEEANITEEIQEVTADILARTFQKYGAPGSLLSGRSTSSTCYDVVTFLTHEATPLQISLQYLHWC
jgi:hypothetical protein